MAHYLVTGGAGFIGSHTVDRLVERGDMVTVLDNFNSYYNPAFKHRNLAHHTNNPNVRVHEGDIREPDVLKTICLENKFDGIVHLAARAGVRPSIDDPILYEETNVRGTYLLYEAARAAGITRIVLSSSSSVYGNSSTLPFSEDMPVDRPVSPYAATKKACEEIAYTYHHLYGIASVCLRFFTVYGERGRPDMAPWKFTDLMLHDKTIPFYGNGDSRRDYTYIADIVSGVVAALDRAPELGFEIINLGNNHPVYLRDFVKVLEEVTGKTAQLERLPFQPGDVMGTWADIRKAQTLLGYDPKTSIKDGLTRFVAWYKTTL